MIENTVQGRVLESVEFPTAKKLLLYYYSHFSKVIHFTPPSYASDTIIVSDTAQYLAKQSQSHPHFFYLDFTGANPKILVTLKLGL